MSRTCGQCAWYEYEKEEPDYGDCMCPLPMSASSEDGYDVDFNSDANGCPCYQPRKETGRRTISVEIKPCPFCGGEAIVSCVGNFIFESRVMCEDCRASTDWYGAASRERSTESAIAAWNRRVGDE